MADDQVQACACKSITDVRRDVLILDAGERRKAAWDRLKALPVSSSTNATPSEIECYGTIDRAEIAIQKAVAVTLQGVEIQLWIALSHSSDATYKSTAELVDRQDLSGLLARENTFDWDARMLLAALRSITSMEVQ
jgi:hypothetical protein